MRPYGEYMNNNDKAIATVTVISSTAIDGDKLDHVRVIERNGFGLGEQRDYYVATDGGAFHSGFCTDAVTACDRLSKLREYGSHKAAGISQAPDGICSEAEMAVAVGHFDSGLKFRDGGVCEHAVRTGSAAGLNSPEWVVASWHIGANNLWR